MLYIPAALAAGIFLLLQWNSRLILNQYGKKAVLISDSGQRFPIRPLMTIGGWGCDIPFSVTRLEEWGEAEEAPVVAELFFKKNDYHLAVRAKAPRLMICRNDRRFFINGTSVLVNGDRIIVLDEHFQDSFTFKMEE